MALEKRARRVSGGENGHERRRFRACTIGLQWTVILGLLAVTGWMAASDRDRGSPAVTTPAVRTATLAEIMYEGPQKLARRHIAELKRKR